MDLAFKGLGDIVPPHSRAVSTAPSTCFALSALNGCCNKFNLILGPIHGCNTWPGLPHVCHKSRLILAMPISGSLLPMGALRTTTIKHYLTQQHALIHSSNGVHLNNAYTHPSPHNQSDNLHSSHLYPSAPLHPTTTYLHPCTISTLLTYTVQTASHKHPHLPQHPPTYTDTTNGDLAIHVVAPPNPF